MRRAAGIAILVIIFGGLFVFAWVATGNLLATVLTFVAAGALAGLGILAVVLLDGDR